MYDNKIAECAPKMSCEPPATLKSKLVSAHSKAIDAFTMARAINVRLFGGSTHPDAKEQPAECFYEALSNHDDLILMIYEELARMTDGLGV